MDQVGTMVDGNVTELHVFVRKVSEMDRSTVNGVVLTIPASAVEDGEVGVIDFYVGRKPDRWIGCAYLPPSVARSVAEQLDAADVGRGGAVMTDMEFDHIQQMIANAETVDDFCEVEDAIDAAAQYLNDEFAERFAAIEAARRSLLAGVTGGAVPKDIDVDRVRIDFASEYETVPTGKQVEEGWDEAGKDVDEKRVSACVMVEVVEALLALGEDQ
jgi:hypothetical protein